MKKILTLVLALTLAFSMSQTLFAATVNTSGGSQDIDVNAKYVDNSETPTVYHVDITWGEMEFTYSVSGTKTWDPAKHDYTVSTSGAWTASGSEITVTNHSNTAVRADFSYKATADYGTVTGKFSSESLTLPTAEGKAIDDTVLVGKIELVLGGTLASDKTDLTKVGEVTVTISKP